MVKCASVEICKCAKCGCVQVCIQVYVYVQHVVRWCELRCVCGHVVTILSELRWCDEMYVCEMWHAMIAYHVVYDQ